MLVVKRYQGRSLDGAVAAAIVRAEIVLGILRYCTGPISGRSGKDDRQDPEGMAFRFGVAEHDDDFAGWLASSVISRLVHLGL